MVEDITHRAPPPGGGYPRKRARTRMRLIRATLEALGGTAPEAITVAQLAHLAGTSQATFYNHFSSVPEIVAESADYLASMLELTDEAAQQAEDDPGVRVALGLLHVVRLAVIDRAATAAFVTLIGTMPEFRGRVRHLVRTAIDLGVELGCFDVPPGESALNAALGLTLQTIQSRLFGEVTDIDSLPAAALLLRTLGVPHEQISDMLERATEILEEDYWQYPSS